MRTLIRKFFTVVKTATKKWIDKDPFHESAVIAYYAIFALPGLLVIIITLAGYFFGSDAVNNQVATQFSSTMGSETANQIQDIIIQASSLKNSVLASIIGTITILIGATGVFAEFQKSLNNIWEVKLDTKKSGIWQVIKIRLFSFGLIISIAFLLIISLLISSLIAAFGNWLSSHFSDSFYLMLKVLNYGLSFSVLYVFAVPDDELTTDKGEDVIQFEDTINQNPLLMSFEKKSIQNSGFTGFDLSSIIEMDKDATLKLLMDPTSSDSLVVKGEAALSFTMDRSGKMSLTGAYNLNEGSYLISLEEVIKRKFDIVPGSTIIWNGDPLDANISINATYEVRTAPYDLVADQMAGLSDAEKGGYKQLYSFLLVLKLRGAILKPEISFEIQLLPEDKGILGGAVNQKLIMMNEDPSALNKQVFALLILGRFVQENPLQSESGGASTLIRSTVSNFLSTQLNQLTSKFVHGVEMNFDIKSYDDYQTGTAQGRTQVGIGLKKQLFNERLSVQIGGNLDVEGAAAKQNSVSNLTGDVTVEYKITKDGRFLLKVFRHNQYEGAIEGQLIETGAGVVFVKDFNKWKKPPESTKYLKKEPINSEAD